MKYLMILTVGVFLLFASVPAVAQSTADEAAIREANEQRIAAWHAKDVKAYLAFYDDDCTQDWTGGPCMAEIRESGEFPEAWKTGAGRWDTSGTTCMNCHNANANAKIKVDKEIGIAFITPDVAILRYTTENTGFLDADGKPVPPGKLQYATVYGKKDGKWLIASLLFQMIEE